MNLRHIGITVKNTETSESFYSLLGFRKVKEYSEQRDFLQKLYSEHKSFEIEVQITHLAKNKLDIELLEFKQPKRGSRPRKIFNTGLSHFALTVKSIDSLYRELSKKINFLSAPVSLPNGTKIVFCTDPDKTLIEFIEENHATTTL